jgi:SAM-dependent methyltransferase/uncharacterized membrane protein YbhN (UPF0104 family)
VRALVGVHPAALALPGLTLIWLALRFIRWQFLLRRTGVRVPDRGSLSSYLAGLPGTATPAYAGELIRGAFLRRKYGVPLRLSVATLIYERLFDVAALGAILAATAVSWPLKATGAGFILAAVVATLVGRRLAGRFGMSAGVLAWLSTPATIGGAFALSIAAWTVAGLLVSGAGAAVGEHVPATVGLSVFSTATLLGAVTLMPAGIGVTGSLAILQLQNLGLALSTAVLIVSLVRLAGTGVALALGTVFLVREVLAIRQPSVNDGIRHFDEIAEHYDREFRSHIWHHLLDRKLQMISAALPAPPEEAGLGLDLGCGLGRQCLEMTRRGYRIVGVDPAQGLLRRARESGATVAVGDALRLPFRDASFDFVYVIGVLHHLKGPRSQQEVAREVGRILKPGGAFIVHETNPRNPLFRFYMGYVFPLLRNIDEGTEWWIDPRSWDRAEGFRLEDVRYFTFLPDFLPLTLMRPVLAVERCLERSPARPYSVHYAAVLRRVADRAASSESGTEQ